MHYNPERVFDAALAVAHIAYAPPLYLGGGGLASPRAYTGSL